MRGTGQGWGRGNTPGCREYGKGDREGLGVALDLGAGRRE